MAKGEEERLDDLPPSAKLVFKVLEYSGPLTQKGIVEESMLSARTVRYALERLEDIDIVDEDVYFADARQNLYQLTEAVPKAATSTDGGGSGSTSSLSDSESDSEPDSEVEPRHAE